MSYSFSSGNFPSQSLGGHLRPSISTYNSFYPSNIIIPPKTNQLDASAYGGQQESFSEPVSSQTSYTGARSFQTSYFRPNQFVPSSPSQIIYPGSPGYGNAGFGSFAYGNTGFQSVGQGSSVYRPAYFSRSFQSAGIQTPAVGSRVFGSAY